MDARLQRGEFDKKASLKYQFGTFL